MKKTENKIQYEIVTWFSQKYPQYRGLLFEANNDTYSRNHAMTRRAMGMVSGVSDLIFIVPGSGKIAGIEIKAEGSSHKKDHIKNQLEWGRTIMQAGGFYIMSSHTTVIKTFINFLIQDMNYEAKEMQGTLLKSINFKLNKSIVKF